jgi:lysophospholipase L1-like esterase
VPGRREILFQLLITIALLALLEMATRLAFTIYAGRLVHVGSDPNRSSWVPTPDLGWDRRPNFGGLDECGSYRSFASNGLVSIDAQRLKSAGPKHRRVVFLGDSNTYGYCLPTESTFVEVAERLLPNFDLINLGVAGYTSAQGYRALLRYGEWIKPDSVFISFNFNDRRYVTGENDVDSDAAFRKMAIRPVQQMLEYSYLFRMVRAVGRKAGIVHATPATSTVVNADNLKPRVDPQNYRANLIKMVEWSREHRSTPYFIMLGDSPNHSERIRRGLAHLGAKDYQAAIRELTFVITYSRSEYAAIARRHLAIAYRQTGQPEQAEKILRMDSRNTYHGGEPLSLDTEYQEIMRAVAQEYDVRLVDAKSKLEETPGVFFDHCHFDAEGHEIVGQLVKEALEKAD